MDLFQDIVQGMHGPGKFRFLLQPAIAILLGLRDGRRMNKRIRHSHYFVSIRKPFLLAWLMDTLFQLLFLRRWNPFEAVIVGIVLVLLPYLLTKNVTNHLTTHVGLNHE